MSLREIRAEAAAALHTEMRVEALYIAPGQDPVTVHVRTHTSNKALGDMKGTSFSYAEKVEMTPTLIFWEAEQVPVRGAKVSISATEAYQVDHVEPSDGLRIRAPATPLSAANRVGLPYPGSV